MKTEEEVIQSRGPRHVPPGSLQELAPLSVTIIDPRGRPVPVCSSGFVLRAGRSYRLRIIPPPDPDFVGAKIQTPPDFIRTDSEVSMTDHGQRVRDLPFRVRKDLRGSLLKLGGLLTDELEVRLNFRSGSGTTVGALTYPIVVRPGPELLLGALLGALLSAVGSLVLPELLSAEKTRGVNFWFYAGFALAGLLVALIVAAYGLAFLQLRHRTHDLRYVFDERYPLIESTT
jgi:hypothetical protein